MARPVSESEEPVFELFSWHCFREGSLFRLCGYRTDTEAGLVTSPLVAADMHARTVVTLSGSLYRLIGEADAARGERILEAHRMRGTVDPLALVPLSEVALALTKSWGPLS